MSKLSDFIGSGVIDDAVAAADSAWSSLKIRSEIDAAQALTETPTLSTNALTLNEFDTVSVVITNYDARLDYVLESLNPAVATATRSGDTISITGSDVDADSSTTIRINAQTFGMPVSNWAEISTNVNSVPTVSDASIQVVSFAGEEQYNSGWVQV